MNEIIKNAKPKLRTLRDCLRFGVSVFNANHLHYGHGTTNVYDEVVYLLLHTLHLPLDQLEVYLDATLLDHELDMILERFDKRAVSRIPSAYITNESILQGYSFYVDSRAIIPRSFIPEIILSDKLFDWIEYPELVHNILDMCTGNASIAVIAADYFYDSKVIASDIDHAALEVAKINIKRYKLEEKIELVQSDIYSNLQSHTNKFDIIFSNPPYVNDNHMQDLTQEYLYEPRHALAGGTDGLDSISFIIEEAHKFLSQSGILVLEIGGNHDALLEMYPGLEFTWLETVSGEDCVGVITKAQLTNYFCISS